MCKNLIVYHKCVKAHTSIVHPLLELSLAIEQIRQQLEELQNARLFEHIRRRPADYHPSVTLKHLSWRYE